MLHYERRDLVKLVYYACAVSTTRLMILGLVSWMQPVHGYDVRSELMSWSVESGPTCSRGSIYHALRKLTEEGLFEEVATEQVGARPARTTYRADAKGRARVRGRCCAATGGSTTSRLTRSWPAFAFLPALPRAEAAAALRNRASLLGPGVDLCAPRWPSDWVRYEQAGRTWAGCSSCGMARAEAEVALVPADRRRGSRPARARTCPGDRHGAEAGAG